MTPGQIRTNLYARFVGRITNHSIISQKWAWLISAACILFVFPLAVSFDPVFFGPEVHLLVIILIWLFFLILFAFGLFAPAHNLLDQTGHFNSHITLWTIRTICAFLFGMSLVILYPLTVGSFRMFVMATPPDIVSGKVVYVHSSSGKRSWSDVACIYIHCSIRLDSDPSRTLDYMLAREVHIFETRTFSLLPGTDIVFSSQ